MKLRSFQVTNYRSVNDSKAVDVARRTTLVGRNESGKTNLLLALEALNLPGGRKALSPTKDFPRDRPLTEFSDTLDVLRSRWQLTDEEQKELVQHFPVPKAFRS